MRRPYEGNFSVLDSPIESLRGVDLFVDTVNGQDDRTGLSWDKCLASVEEATARLAAPKFFGADYGPGNSRIFVVGDVREQFTAPLGVFGVKIIGATGGRPRHSTEGGVCVEGNGCSWRELATAGDAPLITLRQQGWEIHNILMIPESGYSAVKLHRAESATYPDASHFKATGVKFISGGTRVGYGIEDVGGAYHVGVEDCEFQNLEFAWKQTSVGIDSPTSHLWQRNIFNGCKTDISMNAKSCVFKDNMFQTPYDVTTHPTTLNLIATADRGVATAKNLVLGNYFADAAADVTIAKGYKPATGDIWRNHVTDAADPVVAVPA